MFVWFLCMFIYFHLFSQVSEDVGQNDDSEDEEFNRESLTKRLIDNEN